MASAPPYTVASVSQKDQAMDLYRKLQTEEDTLGVELDQLLEQQSQIDVQISTFKRIIPNLQTLHSDSQGLSAAITKASMLAESISGKVRVLDTAKRNVYAALKRVDDIIDLKNCVDGVQQAMTSGNYEQAAVHIRRYLDLDETVLLESAVDATKGSTVSSSFSLLKKAEIELRGIIQDKLKTAVFERDKDSVERFVKIMPLLNLHEEGIKKLTELLNAEIREFSDNKLQSAAESTDDQSGVIYANTLMSVFEDIARKLETYLTTVESAYGSSWIVSFIKEIQSECDKQVEKILKQMNEERLLDHKAQTISIALNSRLTAGAIRPDPRELDTLLNELSLASSRTELYFRFVKKKANAFDKASEICDLLKISETSHKIQEMIGWYILIENYFMRESLSKAISVDESDPSDMMSSLSDDAFFVLQKSLKRAFSSNNIDGACAMINNASTLLLKEYKDELLKGLKCVQTTSQSGGIDLSDFPSMFQSQFQTSTSKPTTPGFDTWRTLGIACSNIEVSCQNLKKLIKLLQNEISVWSSELGETSKAKLDSCLAELCSASGVFQEVRQEAITRFIETLVIPDIRPFMQQFSHISHVIEEDALMDDDFIQRLAALLSQNLDEGKNHLLLELYEDMVLQLVSDLGIGLEHEILSSYFNQLGGVKLDRDLRQLISFLSNRTQHPIRDKFARIMQMASVLSLEKVEEVVEYWNMNSGPALWHLTSREIKQVLHLRRDFQEHEINNLNLSQSRELMS